MGRIDEIKIKPLLLSKGTAKVALYGLGNIRDERLHQVSCCHLSSESSEHCNCAYSKHMLLRDISHVTFCLLQTFKEKKVEWLQPDQGEGGDMWFNILVLHQNKVCACTPAWPVTSQTLAKLPTTQVTSAFTQVTSAFTQVLT
jgi:hypothetical protein